MVTGILFGNFDKNSDRTFSICWLSGSLLSNIKIIRSACSISVHAREMPIRSTSSVASRSPAVSIICKGMPSIWICSRNTSRVVPAISVTIAASLPAKAFSKLDLPAFGRPAITTFIPSRKIEPCFASLRTKSSWLIISRNFASILPSAKKSISSSGKSIDAST